MRNAGPRWLINNLALKPIGFTAALATMHSLPRGVMAAATSSELVIKALFQIYFVEVFRPHFHAAINVSDSQIFTASTDFSIQKDDMAKMVICRKCLSNFEEKKDLKVPRQKSEN